MAAWWRLQNTSRLEITRLQPSQETIRRDVRQLLSPERVTPWDACERDSWRPLRAYAMDWKLAEVALKAEFHKPGVNLEMVPWSRIF